MGGFWSTGRQPGFQRAEGSREQWELSALGCRGWSRGTNIHPDVELLERMEEGEVRGRWEQRGRELWRSGQQETEGKGPPWGRVLLPGAAASPANLWDVAARSLLSHIPAVPPSHSQDTDVKHIPGLQWGRARPGTKALLHFGDFPPCPGRGFALKAGLNLQGAFVPASKGTRTAKRPHIPIPGEGSQQKQTGKETIASWDRAQKLGISSS